MQSILQFFHHLHSLPELIRWGGLVVLTIIIFAETGLFIGFFLPGDSLLVTAGLFAARGDLSIVSLLLCATVAAILGHGVGYWFGQKAGEHLYGRPDSRLFKRRHLEKTRAFYVKHGAKTIVLSRFVPLVRTFAPIVAGVAHMPYGRFMLYNIVGGIGWVFSMCLLGYFLGRRIPGIEQHIDKVIIVVVALSLLPVVIHAYRERAHNREKPDAARRTHEPPVAPNETR
jgi:membrane-associated protein